MNDLLFDSYLYSDDMEPDYTVYNEDYSTYLEQAQNYKSPTELTREKQRHLESEFPALFSNTGNRTPREVLALRN